MGKSFADVSECTIEPINLPCLAGLNVFRIPGGPSHPKLSYLRGIDIAEPPQGIRSISLRDCNGCPRECVVQCDIWGRSLPDEHPRVPPSPGTVQFWSKVTRYYNENELMDFHRTGNLIRSLTLLSDTDVLPLDGVFVYDLHRRPFIAMFYQVAEGIYHSTFDEPLPTVVQTLLCLEGEHKPGVVTIITNDVARVS